MSTGRRYPPKFKREVGRFAAEHGDDAAAEKYGIGRTSAMKWRRRRVGLKLPTGRAASQAKENGRRSMPATTQAIILLRQARAAMPQAVKMDRSHMLALMALDALGGT